MANRTLDEVSKDDLDQKQLLVLLDEAMPECHNLALADFVYRCEKAAEEIRRQSLKLDKIREILLSDYATGKISELEAEAQMAISPDDVQAWLLNRASREHRDDAYMLRAASGFIDLLKLGTREWISVETRRPDLTAAQKRQNDAYDQSEAPK